MPFVFIGEIFNRLDKFLFYMIQLMQTEKPQDQTFTVNVQQPAWHSPHLFQIMFHQYHGPFVC